MLKAESAENESIWDTDLQKVVVWLLRVLLSSWTRVGRPTLMRCHHSSSSSECTAAFDVARASFNLLSWLEMETFVLTWMEI